MVESYSIGPYNLPEGWNIILPQREGDQTRYISPSGSIQYNHPFPHFDELERKRIQGTLNKDSHEDQTAQYSYQELQDYYNEVKTKCDSELSIIDNKIKANTPGQSEHSIYTHQTALPVKMWSKPKKPKS